MSGDISRHVIMGYSNHMWWLPPHFGPKTLATRLPLFFVSIFCPLEPLRLMACPKSKPCNWRKRAIAFLQRWMGNHWRDVFFFYRRSKIWKGFKSSKWRTPWTHDFHLRLTFALLTSRLLGFEIFGAGSKFSREVARCKVNKGRSHVCPPEAPHINILQIHALHGSTGKDCILYEKRISTRQKDEKTPSEVSAHTYTKTCKHVPKLGRKLDSPVLWGYFEGTFWLCVCGYWLNTLHLILWPTMCILY